LYRPPADLPVAIEDNETVLRVVKYPFHFNKNKLTWRIFKPQRMEADVSVVRQIVGNDNCKVKGKEICANPLNGEYKGFAAVLVKHVRETGSSVIDSRELFVGHADLGHGFVVPEDNEPNSVEVTKEINDRCKNILKHTEYKADPAPDSENWSGAELSLSP
jgi:hypothetical protein